MKAAKPSRAIDSELGGDRAPARAVAPGESAYVAGELGGDRAPARAMAPEESASVLDESAQLPLGWRIWVLVRSAVLTVAAALGVVCLLAFGAALLAGIRPLVVISGSMEPTVPVGSVVFTRAVPASELAVGDIVTVERPRELGLVTHRIVEIADAAGGSRELTLKGDANRLPDSDPYLVQQAGRYVWHAPYLGLIALFLQSRQGLVVAIAAAVGLVGVFLLDPGTPERTKTRRAT